MTSSSDIRIKNTTKQRECNIELLRGVLMFMVVALHIIGNNALSLQNPVNVSSDNFIPASIIESFSVLAVDCFIIISGYFGIKASIDKYYKLVLPVVFYSAFIFIINSFTIHEFNKTQFLYELFPVITKKYWFVTAYVLLFLASPFLNSVIKKTDKVNLQRILFIGTLLFVIVPTFSNQSIIGDRGFGVVNFIMLYMWGSYIARFYESKKTKSERIKWFSMYFISSLIITIANIVTAIKFTNHGWRTHWNAYDGLFVYISAISFFILFLNIKFDKSWIMKLSPSFFYVYVIHDNHIVHGYIHNLPILKEAPYSDTIHFIIVTIVAIFAVFFGSLTIDLLRRAIFGVAFEKTSKICARLFDGIMNATISGIKKTPMKRYVKGVVND